MIQFEWQPLYLHNEAGFSNPMWCNLDTTSVMNPGSHSILGLWSSDTLTWATQTTQGWSVPDLCPSRALQHISPLLIHSHLNAFPAVLMVFLVVLLSCNPLILRRLSARCRDCPTKLQQPTSVGSGASNHSLHPLPPSTPSALLCELKSRNKFTKRETDIETEIITWINK